MSKGWDNAMIKKLKALTGKGLSTAEIGRKLGLSKNAVVGKLNRLGWNLKANGGTASDKGALKTRATSTSQKKDATAKKTSASASKSVKKAAADTKTKKSDTKSVTKVATDTKKAASKAGADKNTQKAKKETAAKNIKDADVVSTTKADSKKLNKSLAMHQRIIQHSLEMANLKHNQCRWPIGDPDSENFHFCGETVFVGKPYCYEHCKQAYQFTPPKKK